MKKITLKIDGKEQTFRQGDMVLVEYREPFDHFSRNISNELGITYFCAGFSARYYDRKKKEYYLGVSVEQPTVGECRKTAKKIYLEDIKSIRELK